MQSPQRVLARICTLESMVEAGGIKKLWKCNEHDFVGYYCKATSNKPGENVVFIEIDSVLKKSVKYGVKSPVKTQKICGVVVQGVILPLSVLPENVNSIPVDNLPINYDVTEILGITKDDATDQGNIDYPIEIIPKTEEERIETFMKKLKKQIKKHNLNIQELSFYETEKMDGSSITMYYNNDDFTVASRNRIVDKDNFMYATALDHRIDTIIKNINTDCNINIALQGEICGQHTRENKYKFDTHKIFIFKMFDIKNQKFIDYSNFVEICEKYQIPTVPIISDDYRLIDFDQIKDHVKGKSLHNINMVREGSVFVINRSKTTIPQNILDAIVNKIGFYERLSFKSISTDFLLEYESNKKRN